MDCQPGSSQSSAPEPTARRMVLALTASDGASARILPATCSGDQCLSRMREATRERLAGSPRALARLQASLLASARACAVEAL
jgi:16S rRNA C967 or C1407 C5-methylase (RsmB/RsmF family)